MKSLLLVCACGWSLAVHGQTLRLVGFASLPDHTIVIIEATPAKPFDKRLNYLFLKPGEREAELALEAIDTSQRLARLSFHGTNVQLRLEESPKLPPAAIVVERAGAMVAMKLFQLLRDQTLLVAPEIKDLKCSLHVETKDGNSTAAAKSIEEQLSQQDIVTLAHGEKFLVVAPRGKLAATEHLLAKLPPPAATNTAETLPRGAINLIAAKVEQAASIQAELMGRRFDFQAARNVPFLNSDIELKTQTALTKQEIIHALDVHFAWRGVKIVPVDDKLARMVPLSSL